MNYFAHAFRFLDDPYFMAGTGVPDWLTVADRAVRLRSKHIQAAPEMTDPRMASVAGGILQHLADDAWFHRTRAFAELSLGLAVAVRDVLADPAGFRPTFLGHLLVEVLLDATLIAEDPARLAGYDRALDTVDPELVQAVVNRLAPRSTARLAPMISAFRRERILWDYRQDGKLWVRLNQVMRRVRLPLLPEAFCAILPEARRQVARRKEELLEGPAENHEKSFRILYPPEILACDSD
jgi:hypothetical protein